MNKKGQMGIIGILFIAFVGVIVGASLLIASASNVAQVTTKNTGTQNLATFPTNGNNLVLYGQAVSGLTIVNSSNATDPVPATNYTITNYHLTNGQLDAVITGATGPFGGRTVNLTYTYEPLGYDTSSGGRSVAAMILIFFGLAIAVVALVPSLRGGLAELIGSYK